MLRSHSISARSRFSSKLLGIRKNFRLPFEISVEISLRTSSCALRDFTGTVGCHMRTFLQPLAITMRFQQTRSYRNRVRCSKHAEFYTEGPLGLRPWRRVGKPNQREPLASPMCQSKRASAQPNPAKLPSQRRGRRKEVSRKEATRAKRWCG